ncbi:MAG TPA: D-alanyl-D-alanine carboxypeptidase [Desulfobacteraceae bacterium]|nr:D-alanyl-D-alanine carboxypeptidase [Desulfobacteraceae bacterium]
MKTVLFLILFCLLPGSAAVCGASSGQDFGALAATDSGEIIYAKNRNQPFIPASTLKIFTALGALHYLGEEFTFKTDVFLDREKNLTIKGYGDPLLTSEVLTTLCRRLATRLKQEGITAVRAIVLDDTYFQENPGIPGRRASLNPYDAPTGALCANFNTICFAYSRKEGRYVSGEKQTPLLKGFEKKIRASGLKKGRIPLTRAKSRLYPGMLIKHFLEQEKIGVKGPVKTGAVGNTSPVFFTHHSPYSLTDVIRKMLKFSSNFMANQLFLTIGAEAFSPPATLEKGIEALTRLADNRLHLTGTRIFEGSGLSRQNRTTPEDMLKILTAFRPYHRLMRKNEKEYFKTGTLHGIRTRAGYFTGRHNRLHPFIFRGLTPATDRFLRKKIKKHPVFTP